MSTASENEKQNTLYAVEIVEMSKNHIMFVTFKFFRERIKSLGTNSCKNVKQNLEYLAMIYALTELQKDSIGNYECGYFSSGMKNMILDALKKLMEIIRPQMISLVESFKVHDGVIVSAIGNSYGDIYE